MGRFGPSVPAAVAERRRRRAYEFVGWFDPGPAAQALAWFFYEGGAHVESMRCYLCSVLNHVANDHTYVYKALIAMEAAAQAGEDPGLKFR